MVEGAEGAGEEEIGSVIGPEGGMRAIVIAIDRRGAEVVVEIARANATATGDDVL